MNLPYDIREVTPVEKILDLTIDVVIFVEAGIPEHVDDKVSVFRGCYL